MAFQSLKNFTRTLTSLVNRNQRKVSYAGQTFPLVTMTPDQENAWVAVLARDNALFSLAKVEGPARLGPDADRFNEGEYGAYLEDVDAAEAVAATKVHVVVDWKLPS